MINVATPLPIDMNSDLSSRFDSEKLPPKVKALYFKTYRHDAFNDALETFTKHSLCQGLIVLVACLLVSQV
jgi:hypothetical protein